MSEYFTGVTFPQQKVTPSYDAIVRRSALTDGVLSGCKLSYSGYTLTMGAGVLIACGRQFVHQAVQNWAVSGATSGFARLLLSIDTTRASTKDNFDQIVDSIEYASAIDGFSELQQSDINDSGTMYQICCCVVALGPGGITGIVDELDDSKDPKSRSSEWMPTAEDVGAAPAVESADYPGCYYRIVDDVTEWVNPPMVVGVEYRTTERYNGKAVYSKVVNFGELPNRTEKTVAHGITGATMFVSVHMIASYASSGVYMEYVSGQGDAVSIAGANIKLTTAWNGSGYVAHVFLKYTKD